MIKNKTQLHYYIECDRIAQYHNSKRPKIFGDEVFKFTVLLRKLEYYQNSRNWFLKYFAKNIAKFRYHRISIKLGFSIPTNRIGPGLSIAHPGNIIIADQARIGENCRIHEGVTIGSTNGDSRAPVIGNNVFIGSGAKLIGNINIADGVCIGANAVVINDINEASVTVGGIPAKIISQNNSSKNLVKATEILEMKGKRIK